MYFVYANIPKKFQIFTNFPLFIEKCNTRNTRFMGSNHMNEQFSSNRDLEEWMKCSKSLEYFAKNYWLGFDAFSKWQAKKITPFKYQLEILEQFQENKMNLVVQSRQMHITSLTCLYIAWYALFNTDKVIYIISHNTDSAIRILENIRIILQNCSFENIYHWEDDFIKDNKTTIQLKNGCRIKASGASANAGRGESINFLYIDNAAFVKDLEYIWMATGMALSAFKDSKCIISSSPRENSHFNLIATNAAQSKNDFKLNIIHWSKHPEYSKNINQTKDENSEFLLTSPWYEEAKLRLGNNYRRICEELECVLDYTYNPPKDKTISLRLDQETHDKIQSKLKLGQSVSDYIRTLIAAAVN